MPVFEHKKSKTRVVVDETAEPTRLAIMRRSSHYREYESSDAQTPVQRVAPASDVQAPALNLGVVSVQLADSDVVKELHAKFEEAVGHIEAMLDEFAQGSEDNKWPKHKAAAEFVAGLDIKEIPTEHDEVGAAETKKEAGGTEDGNDSTPAKSAEGAISVEEALTVPIEKLNSTQLRAIADVLGISARETNRETKAAITEERERRKKEAGGA